MNHLIDVGRVCEGFDPPRPRTAIQMSADTSERAHRNTEKRRQALMRGAQLMRVNVAGYVAADEMTGDRLQPRVAVANQHDERRFRKHGQQVIDDELVRPGDVIVQVERLRSLGLMSSAVVGGQQAGQRRGARFRLPDAERAPPHLRSRRATPPPPR